MVLLSFHIFQRGLAVSQQGGGRGGELQWDQSGAKAKGGWKCIIVSIAAHQADQPPAKVREEHSEVALMSRRSMLG